MSDEERRALERRLAVDPADETARVAYGLSLVRAGRGSEALSLLRPETGLGYGALARAAAASPALEPLIDDAPEWRASGGDAGASRWSSAEPVRRPRLAWRRRLEGAHACLGACVDRGRAFVLVQAPGGAPELRAISVLTGESLWRAPLGSGPAAAPVARDGRVFAAAIHAEGGFEVLRTFAFDGASGRRLWAVEERDLEVSASGRLLPGALNLAGNCLLVPASATARGTSTLAELGRRSAVVLGLHADDGSTLWTERRRRIEPEIPSNGSVAFLAVDASLGDARVLEHDLAGRRRGELACEAQRLAVRGSRLALAGRELSVHDRGLGTERSVVLGGEPTSLAIDARRVLVGTRARFQVRDLETWAVVAAWESSEVPLPYAPRGPAQAPPAPRSAVVAGDLAYVASPLVAAVAAWDVRTGERAWRLEIQGLLVPEDGPRFTWPILEVAPPDGGPLFLAPLPGRVLGVTLSGYAFLIEDEGA